MIRKELIESFTIFGVKVGKSGRAFKYDQDHREQLGFMFERFILGLKLFNKKMTSRVGYPSKQDTLDHVDHYIESLGRVKKQIVQMKED